MPSVRAADASQTPPAGGGGGLLLAKPAALEANGGGACGPLSVTSHTLSLSTNAFSVDFSWSRVESDPPPAPRAGMARAPAPSTIAQPAPARARRAPQSFSEILRRQQLAQLLVVAPPAPRDAVLLLEAEAPATAFPGPVCRAYSQAQGPLAQSSRIYSA